MFTTQRTRIESLVRQIFFLVFFAFFGNLFDFNHPDDIKNNFCVLLTGRPCQRHQQIMSKNSQLRGMVRSSSSNGDVTTTTTATTLYKNYPRWPLLALDFLAATIRMDPQHRPTAEELLRHNYFLHDRFPQKFLPALRERVLMEYNSNPLLRRYKADILLASDKKESRRASHFEQQQQPRWKINLADANMKRKFSCETVNLSEVNSFNSLPRNSMQKFALRSNNNNKEQEEEKRSLPGCYGKSNKKNFLKKIDCDVGVAGETIITPLWLGGGNQKKKQEFVKLRNDDFCLPNVPGGERNFLFFWNSLKTI